MPWRHIRIVRFGGPETLELAEEATVLEPGPNEVRIRVLAAGTGFTDTFIRRGRYPDFKGPLPFTPGRAPPMPRPASNVIAAMVLSITTLWALSSRPGVV